ncbi:LOW QUALITY PROTEIN: hypothetical protein HID58_018597, partial [Brassica napus]
SEKLHCLILAPKAYVRPLSWPKSIDYVPYEEMTANKRLRSECKARGVDKAEGELSQQEIYSSFHLALLIVLIGVGDGRCEDMRKFDDKIPKREFDNFQKTTGVAKKINPRPPPTPYTPTIRTELPSPAPDEHTQICRDCGSRISNCPICRVLITSRLRLYT